MIVSEETAISASKEAYVEMLKPYEQQGKVDNDPALKDRVYRITERLIAQVGGKGPPEFFSTHPSPANREKKLSEYVPEMMPYYEKKGDRPTYKL